MVTQSNLVSLDHARKHLIPRRPDGKPVNPSTVWRWIRKGLEGVDGERIRLAVTYAGSRPFVTEDDVHAFFDAVTAARVSRHRRATELAADVTDTELKAAGLTTLQPGERKRTPARSQCGSLWNRQ